MNDRDPSVVLFDLVRIDPESPVERRGVVLSAMGGEPPLVAYAEPGDPDPLRVEYVERSRLEVLDTDLGWSGPVHIAEQIRLLSEAQDDLRNTISDRMYDAAWRVMQPNGPRT